MWWLSHRQLIITYVLWFGFRVQLCIGMYHVVCALTPNFITLYIHNPLLIFRKCMIDTFPKWIYAADGWSPKIWKSPFERNGHGQWSPSGWIAPAYWASALRCNPRLPGLRRQRKFKSEFEWLKSKLFMCTQRDFDFIESIFICILYAMSVYSLHSNLCNTLLIKCCFCVIHFLWCLSNLVRQCHRRWPILQCTFSSLGQNLN